MIIGIDGHMLGDHSGGNESFYYNVLKCMNVDKNDRVYLFVKDGVDTTEFENKFIIVRFKSANALVRNFIELPKLCKKYNLDLLHTQYFIPFYRPCKVVCTIHDICFEHYKNIFTKKEYIRQKLLIPYAAKKSKLVFTVSEDAKKDIVDKYGLSNEKVIVTYNAVNEMFRKLDDKELNSQELRQKFGLGEERYILSVGNLQPRKNLPRLIEAYHKVCDEVTEKVNLVIVGKKAWMYEDIFRDAKNGNGKIIFTDYVSVEDLVRLYNEAACFVYPSFFEGFGIPALEAMACGTPIATSNKTALPEVVGDAGLMFDPFDVNAIKNSIIQLLCDDELCSDLIKKGEIQKQKFNWNETAKIIMESYHNVI